ncbi:uncharacterized protein BCR38DRAFT_485484 [Pseudomassariella vexata]|uniref:Uncharacterized protein n=1 Tax=Pseudomassariella vexata TaxID=1141098 RepID=A0A1Y2E0D2_9PEZI|nr:uncharacterized protein BCR38DRAFT_485484 [Pseudomassariella vexata]ORY64325.1 hypothetical protein BCR38DRAFT_485484 [Pseudomassariella vexata]
MACSQISGPIEYRTLITLVIRLFHSRIATGSMRKVITNQEPRSQISHQTVKTLHFEPEYAETSLSLRQHMRTIFKRSSIPKYSFSVVVEHPSVIQLENPKPISFRLKVIPEKALEHTTEFVADKPPAVTLDDLELRLRSSTSCRDLDIWGYNATDETRSRWQDHLSYRWKSGSGSAATYWVTLSTSASR